MPKALTLKRIEIRKKVSKSIQSGTYTFLLRKSRDYTVEFLKCRQDKYFTKKAGSQQGLTRWIKVRLRRFQPLMQFYVAVYNRTTKSEADAI